MFQHSNRHKRIRAAIVPRDRMNQLSEKRISRGAFIRATKCHKPEYREVKFEGAVTTILEPMSTKRRERLDLHRDLARAKRAGVLTNYLLQELVGMPRVIRVVTRLGDCPSKAIQDTKRRVNEWAASA